MIASIKEQVARFIFREKHPDEKFSERKFSSAFKRSFSFLILMPNDEREFRFAVKVLEFLRENKKNVIPLTFDYRISLLPASFRANAVEHGINDKTKFELPSKKLLGKLDNMRFDVVIDMNRTEVLYYSFIAKHLRAPLKIGFKWSNADKYFNLQIADNSSDPEISYQNLLNCLKMF